MDVHVSGEPQADMTTIGGSAVGRRGEGDARRSLQLGCKHCSQSWNEPQGFGCVGLMMQGSSCQADTDVTYTPVSIKMAQTRMTRIL
mmetsp:Transcript_32381/g.43890  ORF Transcript_32381/g.43890 Transcript_32381/m.43890 type:complete len:87 (-) Transcript_32381:69-329(-)